MTALWLLGGFDWLEATAGCLPAAAAFTDRYTSDFTDERLGEMTGLRVSSDERCQWAVIPLNVHTRCLIVKRCQTTKLVERFGSCGEPGA